MSSINIAGNVSGTVSLSAPDVAGTTVLTLPATSGTVAIGAGVVTAGGVVYTDGTKEANTGAGTSGQYLKSNGASAPSWSTLSASGTLVNTQYFTTTATYTPTTGTNFVIVEVVGGGSGSKSGFTTAVAGGSGGTSSFGALVSATGGSGGTAITTGGSGSGGDINISGGANTNGSGAGGGYARKKITSAFSGVTVTVGAGGTGGTGGTTATGISVTGSGSILAPSTSASGAGATGLLYGGGAGSAAVGASGNAGGQGIVIVYEYA